MRPCPHCLNPIDDDSYFCKHCKRGAMLGKYVYLSCPQCSWKQDFLENNVNNFKMCCKCGYCFDGSPPPREPLDPDIIAAVFTCAHIENVSCELCLYLDGMTIDINDPDFDFISPPLHGGDGYPDDEPCYCDWIYIFKDMEKKNYEINYVRPPHSLLWKCKTL